MGHTPQLLDYVQPGALHLPAMAETINANLLAFESDITELEGEVGVNVPGRVTALEGQMVTANAAIATAQDDIATLDGRVDAAETDITALESKTGSLSHPYEVPFSWNSTSPLTITTVVNGDIINEVEVIIDPAFDGSGQSLKIGDEDDDDRLMTAAENRPGTVGTFHKRKRYPYTASKTIRLTVVPGTATQGGGIARVKVAKP